MAQTNYWLGDVHPRQTGLLQVASWHPCLEKGRQLLCKVLAGQEWKVGVGVWRMTTFERRKLRPCQRNERREVGAASRESGCGSGSVRAFQGDAGPVLAIRSRGCGAAWAAVGTAAARTTPPTRGTTWTTSEPVK